MDVMLYENPMEFLGKDGLGNPIYFENPRRSRRKKARRNPVAKSINKDLTRGVGPKDILAGGVGLAAATILPSMLVKDSTTTTQKILKAGAGVLGAVAAGFAAYQVDKSIAKSAVIGGLAGVAVNTLNSFRPGTIAASTQTQVQRARMLGAARPMIRENVQVNPAFARSDEIISVIQP